MEKEQQHRSSQLDVNSAEVDNKQNKISVSSNDSETLASNCHQTTYARSRFIEKALATRARALNSEFTPFRPPEYIVDRLNEIDAQSAVENESHQDLNGVDCTLNNDQKSDTNNTVLQAGTKLSTLKDGFGDDRDCIKDESRFYQRAKKAVMNNKMKGTRKEALKRNIKITIIVVVAFIAYIIYGSYIRSQEGNELQNIKDNLPYALDSYTVIYKVEENNDGVELYIEKSNKLYLGLNQSQIQAKLDKIANNAQNLCKIPFIYTMIESGKSLKVLLNTEDHLVNSSVVVNKCAP